MDNLRVARVDNVTLDSIVPPPVDNPAALPKKERAKGTLHLTPHHLIFSPSSTPAAEVWIPYPSITLLTRLPQTFGGVYPLQIRTRTFHSYVLGFEKAMEGGAEDVWLSVKDCAVASSVEQLYAFFYTLPFSSSAAYSARKEFARQGVGARTKAWRFTDINKDYTFCPTYPAKMVVPSRISDAHLSYAGKYRSKSRIPALTYLHWANQASITRSSQPMVGLKNSRSAQDERLVECIFTAHLFDAPTTEHVYGATSTNLIIDARPTTNAMANVAMGAGTENMENYKMAKKAYLGIDNIHVMRNSLKIIAQALNDAETTPVDRGQLRKSNWLKHISTVLDGSLVIIKNIHLNASHVLIHCSDGWDRTAQLSAVAQICLDPYYRKFEGFKVLVEKDWLSFGHKFLDRSGHLSSEKFFTVDQPDDDSDEEGGAQKAAQAFFASVQKQFKSDGQKEVSPVFHQFLDCVRQIQRQFPTRFEWNEQYLLDIYQHLYSCQFGTFLFNNERQRRTSDDGAPYVDRTVSAWEWFDTQRDQHRNDEFNPSIDQSDEDRGVLLFDPRDVKFWHRLFRRGDEEMNGNGGRVAQIGAEVVTVLPGQVDPAAPEGLLATGVHGPSTRTPRDPSPNPASSSQNTALDGPSGKGTFRAIDSTSSAFSLQTQQSHSPNPDSHSFASPSPRKAASSSSSNAGWGGWSHFSSGAISALQRGAKEIRTIGEGAYNQIRAEIDADDGRVQSLGEREREREREREMSVGQGRPGGVAGIPRLPSEANPWASSAPSAPIAALPRTDSAGRTGGTGGTGGIGGTGRMTRQDSWNTNPWDTDVAKSTIPDRSRNDVKPISPPSNAAALDTTRRSLADLTLLDTRTPSPLGDTKRAETTSTENAPSGNVRASSVVGPAPSSTSAAHTPNVTPPASSTPSKVFRQTTSSTVDKDLEDALGGDRKAWDPLGAI